MTSDAAAKVDNVLVFFSSLIGCALIFGLPVAVDQLIKFSYKPSKELTDGGELITFVAIAFMVGFMVNLGLFNAATYDRGRYALFVILCPIVAAGAYAIAFLYAVESDESTTEAD